MDPHARDWARGHLLKRAAEDSDFRQALLRDPRAAMAREFGEPLPDEYDIRVLEEGPTAFYVVLPPPPPNGDSVVTLREITRDNVRAICRLEVHESQRGFVAPNPISIAEAHVTPTAWMRAIYADETPVGFVMINDDPEKPRYYLWRYMIAGAYQQLGFGRGAMEQVIDYVRTRPGATEFLLSYVPGEGSPRDFYARLGFVDTGEQHGGESVMRLAL
jgi:diamine N-acetyltransferase